ncbi:hypothetical protein Hanom_Chr05g00463011 [Helianthus anomalus]
MFVHLTKRTKFLVRVRLFDKRTNTNELRAERFTNCLPNVWFVCSPKTVHHHKWPSGGVTWVLQWSPKFNSH